jgi:hypothetical protein
MVIQQSVFQQKVLQARQVVLLIQAAILKVFLLRLVVIQTVLQMMIQRIKTKKGIVPLVRVVMPTKVRRVIVFVLTSVALTRFTVTKMVTKMVMILCVVSVVVVHTMFLVITVYVLIVIAVIDLLILTLGVFQAVRITRMIQLTLIVQIIRIIQLTLIVQIMQIIQPTLTGMTSQIVETAKISNMYTNLYVLIGKGTISAQK